MSGVSTFLNTFTFLPTTTFSTNKSLGIAVQLLLRRLLVQVVAHVVGVEFVGLGVVVVSVWERAGGLDHRVAVRRKPRVRRFVRGLSTVLAKHIRVVHATAV